MFDNRRSIDGFPWQPLAAIRFRPIAGLHIGWQIIGMGSPKKFLWFAAVAIGLLGAACAQNAVAGAIGPDTVPSCANPAIPDTLGDIVAGADLIVVAAAQVPKTELIASSQSTSPTTIASVRVLKGTAPENGLTLRFYPSDDPFTPTVAAIIAADAVPSLYFLAQLDADPAGFYFASNTRLALQRAEAASVERTQREVARQQEVLEGWKAKRNLPYYGEVEQLIAQLATLAKTAPSGTQAEIEAQQQIFGQLEALGQAAVPAIIAQMDDRRPLAFQQISLVNKNPDAWEGIRHYGPKLIVDGLDAILNQITSKSFGTIHNGGSERERRATVDAWRIFEASLSCAGPKG